MKKSLLTLIAALVLFNANVFAGSLRTGGKTLVESGRTTELTSWLKDICGATGSGTSYTITTAPNNNAGDVYFVGINNYWVGSISGEYSVYDQVNSGITLIDKVQDDNKQETSTGTFYTYQAKNANKFFFIVRNKKAKSGQPWNDDMAFAYYNEYSYVDESSAENIGYDDLTAKWNNLKDGEPFPAPHDCDTSLETNHYITLNDKEDDEAPLHNFTAFLYVPNTATMYKRGDIYYVVNSINGGHRVNSIKEDLYCIDEDGDYVLFKNKYTGKRYYTTKPWGNYETVQTYKKAAVPYVFFYNVTMTEATLQANGNIGNACNYNVALNWSTVFDKYAKNKVQQTTQYDTMKEYYILERSYDMTNWEEVSPSSLKEVSGNNVRSTAGKTFIDTELKDFDENTKVIGYTVYYRVRSQVMKSDTNTKMAETQSNIVTVNIPGTAPFSLTLLSGGTSKYDPTANNKAGANTFCNSLVAAETAAHAAVTLAEGAELSLIRVDESNPQGVAVKTVKVTDANISLAELVAQIPNNPKTGTYTEEFTTAAGESKDATYQLILKVPVGNNFEYYYSNKATIANAKVNALAVVAHRSGTPDENKSDIDETFHNEVKFAPTNTGIGTGYYIYRNGEQIADLIDNGNGTFSLRNTTEEISLNTEGQLVYIDLVDNAPIAIGETDNGNYVASWGYSVAHYDDSNNTYGSAKTFVEYKGVQNELVVNTNGTIAAALIPSNGTIYVSTKVNWTTKSYSDTQAQSYSIYRRIKGEETEYQLIQAVDAITTEVEIIDIYYREAGKTGNLTTNEVKTYDFYVTMTTTNNELKNSQVYTPTISVDAIFTGINEVEMAEIDVTVANGIVTVNGVEGKIVIYSINGQEVAMAESDGSTTKIDITSLESGVYVVKGENVKSAKILILR